MSFRKYSDFRDTYRMPSTLLLDDYDELAEYETPTLVNNDEYAALYEYENPSSFRTYGDTNTILRKQQKQKIIMDAMSKLIEQLILVIKKLVTSPTLTLAPRTGSSSPDKDALKLFLLSLVTKFNELHDGCSNTTPEILATLKEKIDLFLHVINTTSDINVLKGHYEEILNIIKRSCKFSGLVLGIEHEWVTFMTVAKNPSPKTVMGVITNALASGECLTGLKQLYNTIKTKIFAGEEISENEFNGYKTQREEILLKEQEEKREGREQLIAPVLTSINQQPFSTKLSTNKLTSKQLKELRDAIPKIAEDAASSPGQKLATAAIFASSLIALLSTYATVSAEMCSIGISALAGGGLFDFFKRILSPSTEECEESSGVPGLAYSLDPFQTETNAYTDIISSIAVEEKESQINTANIKQVIEQYKNVVTDDNSKKILEKIEAVIPMTGDVTDNVLKQFLKIMDENKDTIDKMQKYKSFIDAVNYQDYKNLTAENPSTTAELTTTENLEESLLPFAEEEKIGEELNEIWENLY